MKRLVSSLVFFAAMAFSAHAQFDALKKKIADKGKKVFEKHADKERDRLDSSDFNFAISVIDNSGMMDIRNFDETKTKALSAVSNTTKDEDQITPAQKDRNILDWAERFYEGRKFKLAELKFLEAKLSYENDKLTGNINYSKVNADLGLLYATMGRFNTAEQYTVEALDIRERTLGKNSKAYASSLNNIAVLYQETARYNESEKYFSEALQAVKTLYGDESQEYAIVLNNQAFFLSKIGRYDKAIETLNNSISILEKGNASKANLRNFQSNLALLYQQTGKLQEAESIYLKLEKALGSKDPRYAGVLDNLGLLYIQMNKIDQVEGYLNQAKEVYKTKFGDKNPNYAKVLNDLGNFYRMQGRFDEGEKALIESLSIRATALDSNHPDYVKSQEDLGILYWKKGDLTKAYSNLQIAMTKSLDFVSRYFPPMSEAEKTKYWDILQPRFQRFYNYCLEASVSNPSLAKDMYDFQIATKALLLNSTNKIKQAILASGNNDLIKDYLAWLDKKETLARYYSLSKEDLNEQKIDLAALEQEANNMERSLSQRSTEFSTGYSNDKISFGNISSLLTETEAAVELIRIRSFDKDFTSDSKYAALVLTKGAEQPKMIILDNGNQLETRYAKFYRNSIQQKSVDQYSYDQFWGRIDPSLSGKKTIYVSPDGVYNQINLNTLKKTGRDFVINRYDLVIVGNSKDIIGMKKQKVVASKKEAFLLGFPDYGGTTVAALPGTKVEIEGISKILATAGYKTSRFEQKEATEAKLKSIKGPSLIHIATHGYFLQDEEGVVGVTQENAKNNPLLRSGLLLAGASKTMSGDVLPNLESNDNGILTAYEAMNLSLDGTDLIVLSACETGLGDIRAGEGVYGLQRAFLVAGAKAMVMSLWKVDDAATQALMTNFYINLSKGNGKLKAFKQAQIQLMTQYKDPYYWGAFVMMGM